MYTKGDVERHLSKVILSECSAFHEEVWENYQKTEKRSFRCEGGCSILKILQLEVRNLVNICVVYYSKNPAYIRTYRLKFGIEIPQKI